MNALLLRAIAPSELDRIWLEIATVLYRWLGTIWLTCLRSLLPIYLKLLGCLGQVQIIIGLLLLLMGHHFGFGL